MAQKMFRYARCISVTSGADLACNIDPYTRPINLVVNVHPVMNHTDGVPSTRRTVLTAAGSGLAVGLAGCMSDSDELPEPVSLDDGQACDQCGMVNDQHPGPTGQVFFESHPPDDERPAWFCSVICTYTYRFDRENEGEEPIVTYLTDYSDVDYSVDNGDEPMMSAHLSSDGYRNESELSVVVGSDVYGAMGPELIPFSNANDAEEFANEYGGEVRSASDVDQELSDSVRSF